MLLADDSFKILVNSAPNPGICDPAWSPDGRYIAFVGVTQSGNGTDGRLDVYIAEATGYGARNLTGRLGGQIRLLGWVGGP
jgi:Tol biopolymer transport system component